MDTLEEFLTLFRQARTVRLREIDVAAMRAMMGDDTAKLDALKEERRRLLDYPKIAGAGPNSRAFLASTWPANLGELPATFLEPEPPAKLGKECVLDLAKIASADNAADYVALESGKGLPPEIDLNGIITTRRERAAEEAKRPAPVSPRRQRITRRGEAKEV